MNGSELLDKMELIDPAFVEAADRLPQKKPRRARIGVIAACVCLLAGALGVLALNGSGTRIISFINSHLHSELGESGYELAAEIEKFPESDFKGKLGEVPALIRAQYAAYEPYMSSMPGVWQRTFETRDEACDHLGFDGLTDVDLELDEGQTDLRVYGNERGELLSVTLETSYALGDISLQMFTYIYTEHCEGEISLRTVTSEEVDFSEETAVTASGRSVLLVSHTALAGGREGIDAYFVEGGVLYDLHISYPTGDGDRARELIMTGV